MPTPTIPNFSNFATDPMRNFRFVVTIIPNDLTGFRDAGVDFLVQLGFVSVEGLNLTTEAIAYREGGMNTTVHQMPGQTTFSPITLSRGISIGTRQNATWANHLFSVIQGAGDLRSGNDFRANAEIELLQHPVTNFDGDLPPTKLRWKVYNCWPTTLAYSALNAGDNALEVEQMTLVHEGLATRWATDAGTGEAPEFTL